MKRVLCLVGSMDMGGAESFLMKLDRSLDHTRFQMDFCVTKSHKGVYEPEIKSMGGMIFRITPKSKNPVKSASELFHIVKDNRYNYVLRVSQNSLSTLDLLVARLAGAKVLIYRSSNSKTMKPGLESWLHYCFRFLAKSIPTVKIAPSVPAAEFMFGKKAVLMGKVLLLNNGLSEREYRYSPDKRSQLRDEIGLEKNDFVVGHIGRFVDQKNHEKIIEIFNRLIKKRVDSKLVLVGTGPLESKITDLVRQYDLQDHVVFLGVRNDVSDLLSVFDSYLFPSKYEGMPNTVIEAQANGLPCVISSTITPDVKINSNLKFCALEDSDDVWIQTIIENIERVNYDAVEKNFRYSGYEIETVTKQFEEAVFE